MRIMRLFAGGFGTLASGGSQASSTGLPKNAPMKTKPFPTPNAPNNMRPIPTPPPRPRAVMLLTQSIVPALEFPPKSFALKRLAVRNPKLSPNAGSGSPQIS